jgi:hypothetical protein
MWVLRGQKQIRYRSIPLGATNRSASYETEARVQRGHILGPQDDVRPADRSLWLAFLQVTIIWYVKRCREALDQSWQGSERELKWSRSTLIVVFSATGLEEHNQQGRQGGWGCMSLFE